MSEHLPALTVKAPDHPPLPGRTAAHKAPLSPPAHAPVPRGGVDKRGSVGGGTGGEEAYDFEVDGQGNRNKVNDLVHQHKCRVHFETLCFGLQELNLQTQYTVVEYVALTRHLFLLCDTTDNNKRNSS